MPECYYTTCDNELEGRDTLVLAGFREYMPGTQPDMKFSVIFCSRDCYKAYIVKFVKETGSNIFQIKEPIFDLNLEEAKELDDDLLK